jgi:hypothetical protein
VQRHSFSHVSVWLDDHSSEKGALAQSLDWAARLRLPLRVVVTSTRFANHAADQDWQANGAVHDDRESAPIVEKIKTWGSLCAQRGVIMETSFWAGETKVGIDQFLRPWSLCVFEDNRSDPVREKLLARCTGIPEVSLLLAPPTYRPMTRVLILYHHQNPSAYFLETAAGLCQALEVQPLILTVASSERDAGIKQSFAQGVCSSLHLQADFDSVVAFDVRSATLRVAAWRSCSHVLFERPKNVSLWQRLRDDINWKWLRSDIFSELSGLSESLTFLALSEEIKLDMPRAMGGNRLNRSLDFSCRAGTEPT